MEDPAAWKTGSRRPEGARKAFLRGPDRDRGPRRPPTGQGIASHPVSYEARIEVFVSHPRRLGHPMADCLASKGSALVATKRAGSLSLRACRCTCAGPGDGVAGESAINQRPATLLRSQTAAWRVSSARIGGLSLLRPRGSASPLRRSASAGTRRVGSYIE
jgi:hypothetical protein